MISLLRLCSAIIIFSVSLAWAQAIPEEDYEKWNTLAVRAETVLSEDRASEAAYDDLRSQIVEWRETF